MTETMCENCEYALVDGMYVKCQFAGKCEFDEV